MRRYSLRLLCFVLVTILNSHAARKSDPEQPITFQSNVRVVLLDVVVTDHAGNPVMGLTQDDFRIFEDKKLQKVSSFKEHRGAPVVISDLPPFPNGTYTNYPVTSTADSINVLLMDSLNTPIVDQDFAHQQVIKYLKTIPPGARVAIFTLSSHLRLVQGFTADTSRLLAVLNDPKLATPQMSPLLQSQTEQQADSTLIDNLTANRMGPMAAGDLQTDAVDPVNSLKAMLAERSAGLIEDRVAITMQAFQQLARYLSGYPGRKNVMWASGGFPLMIFPQADTFAPAVSPNSFTDELQKTADLCTAAQVSIYPISAEGLLGDPTYQTNGAPLHYGTAPEAGATAMQNFLMSQYLSHASMESLAKDTGGQAFYNTNGLKEVLAKVTDEGMHYYTLTYTPTNNKMDGSYRHTRVEIPNHKYKASYRRGYYATETSVGAGLPSTHLPLLPLMSFGLPDVAQLIFKLSITPSSSASVKPKEALTSFEGPATHYSLDLAVSLYQVDSELLPDGNRRAQLEVRAVAYDDAGKPLAMGGEEGAVILTPRAFEEAKTVGIHLREQLVLPADRNVHLRTGIYDLRSGHAGTLGVRFRTAAAAESKLGRP